MDDETRSLVRRRADNQCEYCRLHQDQEPFYRLHVEHIRGLTPKGRATARVLALNAPGRLELRLAVRANLD